MQLKTYPLNNIEYAAEDAELFHCTRTSGVYGLEDFTASIDAVNNKIIVSDGVGWIKNGRFSGKVIALKEITSLAFATPDPVYDRIDAIVLQFDAAANSTNLIVKTGNPSSNPSEPEVIRTESLYELHLYHVLRNAGQLTISDSDIIDLRAKTEYCGIMVDSVSQAFFDHWGTESEEFPGCYYRMVGGEREWINPPMIIGEHYRTNKRHKGKPVYVTSVDLGVLPSSSSKSINIASDSSGFSAVVSLSTYAINAAGATFPFPMFTSAGYVCAYARLGKDGKLIVWTFDSNMNSYTGLATAEYTK